MSEQSEEKSKGLQDIEIIKKPLEFLFPATALNRFSDYVTVQQDREHFTVSFFEIQKPILLGTPEENKETFRKLGSIPAVCVARIIMTPTQIDLFIKTLQTSVDQRKKSLEKEEP